MVFKHIACLLLLSSFAGAGGIVQGGFAPQSASISEATVTIPSGTGSACFSADNPTLVVDCSLHKVSVGGAAGLVVTYGTALSTVTASTITLAQNGATVNVFPNSPLMVVGNTNTYFQQVIQNLSSGSNASSDYILVNDLGADASYYLDIGINSSLFSQAGQSVEASSSAFVTTSDSDLVLWADTNGGLNNSKNGSVIIGSSNPVTGNTALKISSNSATFTAASGSPVTTFNGGATGSPELDFSQSGTVRAYMYYNNATSSMTINRSGNGSKGIQIDSNDNVYVSGDTAGQLIVGGKVPVTGALFSVGGSTFVVQNGSVSIHGTIYGDSAKSGDYGEFISTSPTGNIVVAASTILTNISTSTLTPGDWDVTAVCDMFNGGTFAGTALQCCISLTANTFDFFPGCAFVNPVTGAALLDTVSPTPTRRISVSVNTPLYLVAGITYTVSGTATWRATGTLMRARRMR